jgi:hypothetical protein
MYKVLAVAEISSLLGHDSSIEGKLSEFRGVILKYLSSETKSTTEHVASPINRSKALSL